MTNNKNKPPYFALFYVMLPSKQSDCRRALKGALQMKSYNHLTLSERILMEQKLNQRSSLKAIGRDLGRDCKTISNEVKNHRIFRKTGGYGRNFNDCLNRLGCPETEMCQKDGCKKKCCFCGQCYTHCPVYKKEICALIGKVPYVCNGCAAKQKCTLEKAFYQAKSAQAECETIRSETQSGIVIDATEAKRIDDIISPLVRKGQSIHHIFATHADEIMLSEKTIYNYYDRGVFSTKNIDLPRKVRYRPRKSRHDAIKQDKSCRIGRTYNDYLTFLQTHPDTPIVQMDTVEGTKGGSVLLTIHFRLLHFMLAFLRPANTAHSVQDAFEWLYSRLGHENFLRLFQLILTDNGSEFSNPLAIELNSQGVRRSRIFYCDPMQSQQKGALENNHEMIRRIVPKGVPFDPFVQDDITLMTNHINSYTREALNNLTPYEAFRFFYGHDILKKMGAELIPPDDIILHPSLLKK
jgi:IS30 family transposase